MRSGAALLSLAVFSLVLAGSGAARSVDLVAPAVSVSCSPGGSCAGWFTGNVNVSFSWNVPSGEAFWSESGCNGFSVASDTSGQSYSCQVTVTPDGGTTTVSSSVSGSIKRDATPPTVSSVAATRGPDSNGWYNHAVTVSASGSDSTSGVASCTTATYSGPDSATVSVTGTCTDAAGNVSAPKSVGFQYDGSAPSVSPQASRGPDANGWYNHPVSVAFTGSDGLSGIDSCTSTSYGGPDGTGLSVSGTCRDKAGNGASGSFSLSYDATPPTVTGATASRAPDSGGWYNHPVDVVFQGNDAGSGVDSCSSKTYSGPDSSSASVSGTCQDKAGNASAVGTFALKYDATPPTLTDVRAATGDESIALTWKASKDVARVEISRLPGAAATAAAPLIVYSGPADHFTDTRVTNRKKYVYSVAAYDAAGNKVIRTITAVPQAPLSAPVNGAIVASPPTLAWKKDPHASYYNVQLFRGTTKLLTSWPTHPWLKLQRSWRYESRSVDLVPGRYRWYVWPGYGTVTARRYGKLIGVSTFVVKR